MIDGFWLKLAALFYVEAWILGTWADAPGWGIGSGVFALAFWLWGLRDSGR